MVKLPSSRATDASSTTRPSTSSGERRAGHDAISIMDRVHSWISDFYNVVKLVKRLDRHEGDFLKEMEEHEDVRFYVHRIIVECELNQRRARTTAAPSSSTSTCGPRTSRRRSRSSSRRTALNEDGRGRRDRPRSSLVLRRAHRALKDTVDEIKALPDQIFQGWLKIDAKPDQERAQHVAAKWARPTRTTSRSTSTTSSTTSRVHRRASTRGLAIEVEENDSEQLIAAMTHVRDVRVTADRIDGLFEPLQRHDQPPQEVQPHMPDETMEQLENVPFKWEDTKKVTSTRARCSARCSRMQQEKVASRPRTSGYRVRLRQGLPRERRPSPSSIGHDDAYKLINEHATCSTIEQEAKAINEAPGALRGRRHHVARAQDLPRASSAAQAGVGPRAARQRDLHLVPRDASGPTSTSRR